MAGGAEAARQRDLGDRLLAVPQQLFRPLQPGAHHKLVRRQAGGVLEHAGEVVLAQSGLRRQIRQQQRPIEVVSIYSRTRLATAGARPPRACGSFHCSWL